MHATRGAWVGRTFALAKFNESSGGRKPRTRRSKEERKELVESFIKRHQKLNNGSFPSLNLTHKEVGGSYYIVREIVREIIQENRVLAPPNSLSREHNVESFLEQHPLGSISVDPHIDVVSSNESHILVNNHQLTSEEHVSDSRMIELDQGTLDNGTIVSGNAYATVENKDSEIPIDTEFIEDRGAEGGVRVEKESNPYQVRTSNLVKDVEDEIIPLEVHNMERLLEHGSLESVFDDPQIGVEAIEESEIVVSCHQSTSEEHVLDGGQICQPDQGSLVNGKMVNGSINAVAEIEESRVSTHRESLLETVVGDKDGEKELRGYHATSQIAEDKLVETLPFRSDPHTDYDLDAKFSKSVIFVGSSKEKDTEDFNVEAGNSSVPDRLHFHRNSFEMVEKNLEADLAGLLPEMNGVLLDEKAPPTKENTVLDGNDSTDLDVKDTVPAGNKPIVAPDSIHSGALEQAISIEAGANEKHPNIQDGSSSKNKGNIQTLDRTKLESWESSSEKPSGQKTNPLMALIKSVVNAFVKFWTEE